MAYVRFTHRTPCFSHEFEAPVESDELTIILLWGPFPYACFVRRALGCLLVYGLVSVRREEWQHVTATSGDALLRAGVF